MLGTMANLTNELRKLAQNIDLDRIDIGILRALQNDARLSVKEIAAQVGLDASSNHERIQRLRDSGVIRGSHVDVNPRAFGVGLEALFMIGLEKHKRGTVDRLMNDIV